MARARLDPVTGGSVVPGVDFGFSSPFHGGYTSRYQTERKIGSGGFSSVYLVRDTADDSEAVSKVTHLLYITDAPKWQRTQARGLLEIKIFHAVQGMDLKSGHDNILKLLEWYTGPSTLPEYYSIMVCVFERCYSDLRARCRRMGRSLSEDEAKPVMQGIVDGMRFLHEKGIAHRDVKLENVLCGHPTDLTPVKLCDFNMSRYIDHSERPSPMTHASGTPIHMDPQRLSKHLGYAARIGYTRKCDCWAVGLLMYELLAFHGVFAEKSQCNRTDCKAIVTQSDETRVYDPRRVTKCMRCYANNLEMLCTEEFDAERSSVSSHTQSCKDLITRLLLHDEEDRLSFNEAASHQWLQNHQPVVTAWEELSTRF